MRLTEKRVKSARVWANPESIDGVGHTHVKKKKKIKKIHYDFAACVGKSKPSISPRLESRGYEWSTK